MTPRTASTRPTETSPLLPKPNRQPSESTTPLVHPCDGVTPKDAAHEDGGDIERQVSNGDTSKHQGLPEVKRRMKYIFPAIAIGVSSTDANGMRAER